MPSSPWVGRWRRRKSVRTSVSPVEPGQSASRVSDDPHIWHIRVMMERDGHNRLIALQQMLEGVNRAARPDVGRTANWIGSARGALASRIDTQAPFCAENVQS
jgi:hypothetical protein